MPENFLLAVSRLENRTDEIVAKSLEAGGAVVLSKVRGNLRSSVGRGIKYQSRSTGELIGALGISPVKVDRRGNHNLKIGFSEPRRSRAGGKRVSNAMLANILEYGKHGQPAKPFLRPARNASRAECIRVMTAALESEIRRLM
jgi:HK97 gp10 family phage protein